MQSLWTKNSSQDYSKTLYPVQKYSIRSTKSDPDLCLISLISPFTFLPPPPRRQKKSAPPQFKISAALIKACICTWNHQLRCITDGIRHRPPSWEQHSRSIFLLVVVGTPVSSVVLYTLRLSLSCSGVSPSRGRWKVGEKWAPRKEGGGGGGGRRQRSV